MVAAALGLRVLGVDPLRECVADPSGGSAEAISRWSERDANALVGALEEELGAALDGVSVRSAAGKDKPVRVDSDPYLGGLWGFDCECTLSHQSVRLGVPA